MLTIFVNQFYRKFINFFIKVEIMSRAGYICVERNERSRNEPAFPDPVHHVVGKKTHPPPGPGQSPSLQPGHP